MGENIPSKERFRVWRGGGGLFRTSWLEEGEAEEGEVGAVVGCQALKELGNSGGLITLRPWIASAGATRHKDVTRETRRWGRLLLSGLSGFIKTH